MIVKITLDDPKGVNLDCAEFLYLDNVVHIGNIITDKQIELLTHGDATVINSQAVDKLGEGIVLKEVKRLTGVACKLVKSVGSCGGYIIKPNKKTLKKA